MVLAVALTCGIIGFFVPLMFDRDVGGGLASVIFGSAAVVFGIFLGLLAARRSFE
ncbi:MAG: hypothetical protein HY242_13745 [Afipia sp.]|nr:hypothetical protein [Afipia sp.]